MNRAHIRASALGCGSFLLALLSCVIQVLGGEESSQNNRAAIEELQAAEAAAPLTSQRRLFSSRSSDGVVREWNAATGDFLTNLVVLNDLGQPVLGQSDIEFDGEFFYTISSAGPFIRRFNSAGQYLDAILLTEIDGSPVAQPQIGLAVYGGYLYTIAAGDARVRRFNGAGRYEIDACVLNDSLGPNTTQIALATDGRFFYTIAVSDYRVRQFELSGVFVGDALGFNHGGVPDNNNMGLAIQPLPPFIHDQPDSVAVVIGNNAGFSVTASGMEPLTYRWYLNGSPVIAPNSGLLLLSNVQPVQAGPYFVVVSNAVGSVTSLVATLDVLTPPQISGQPVGGAVVQGNNTSLNVAATGSAPLTYRWFFNGSPLMSANAATLPLNNVQPGQGGFYHVVISNVVGSVTSLVVALEVLTPPLIAEQPTGGVIVRGDDAGFGVVASGAAPLSYRWFFNGQPLPSSNASTLLLTNVQPAQSGFYFVVVSNVVTSVTSAVATLEVLVPPAMVDEPSSVATKTGEDVSFTVSAAGIPTPTITWYFNNAFLNGATGPVLLLSNVQPQQGGSYFAVASNLLGSATSAVVTLRVTNAPVLTQQPASVDGILGGDVMLSATAISFEPVTWQWFFKGRPIRGATNATLALGKLRFRSAGRYHVEVRNTVGTVRSQEISLRVFRSLRIVTQPRSKSVVLGKTLTLRTRASGSKPVFYQWFKDGETLPGATSSSLIIRNFALTNAGTYSVTVSNLVSTAVSSPAVVVLK